MDLKFFQKEINKYYKWNSKQLGLDGNRRIVSNGAIPGIWNEETGIEE